MFKIFIIFFCICFPLKADQYDLRLKNLFNQLQETEIETEKQAPPTKSKKGTAKKKPKPKATRKRK